MPVPILPPDAIFGLSVFCSLLAPAGFSAMLLRKNQTLMMWSGAVAAVTSVGTLSIQAMLMGNGWSDGLNLNVWLLVLTTTFGEVWRWHLLLTAALMLVLLMDWLSVRICCVLCSLVFAESGADRHASCTSCRLTTVSYMCIAKCRYFDACSPAVVHDYPVNLIAAFCHAR